MADRAADYRRKLAAAFEAVGRPADAEPLLQQLLEGDGADDLGLLISLGNVQVRHCKASSCPFPGPHPAS